MLIELENLTIPIWIYDIDRYRILWANQPALNLWESDSIDDLRSRSFKTSTTDAMQATLLDYRNSFSQGDKIAHNWHFSPNGIDKHAFCQLSGYELEDGRMAMLVEALPVNKFNYDSQVGLTAMLSSYSAEGELLNSNSPFVETMGRQINHLQDLISDAAVLKTLHRSLSQSLRFEGDVLINAIDGHRWCHLIAVAIKTAPDAGYEKIVLHQYDIHKRKISEIALEQEALTDALTGLLNRRGLEQKLEALDTVQQPFMLCYIDLDGFKLINDSFGHGTGDEVLQLVSDRLTALLPSDQSFACRFGGDEFIVGITLDGDHPDEELFAGTLVSNLSDTYHDSRSRPMSLSASIGVVRFPQDVENIDDVVLCGDAAMYSAKQSGKRRWVQYQPGMEEAIRRQSLIAQHLYNAEQKDELALYYQPVWDFSETPRGKVVSFEALLRWYNDELGWVTAEESVKAAEEIGVIDKIERWVASQALNDLAYLRRYIAPEATMAINISAVHLLDPTLPDFLLGIIEETTFSPEDLTVELTENTLIGDIENDNSAVQRLVDTGIKISIDDFGTGYSSLAYLHHIPAHTVKLDRAFVEQIEHNSKTVRYIHQLIRAHGMRTLIEGVETKQQRQKLLDLDIHLHQGYLLGAPKPLSYYIEGATRTNTSVS